jgi:serine/threonine protein kinase
LQPFVSQRSFRIASCLGQGGFGEVYRAVEEKEGGLESEVALKVLRKNLDPSGQSVMRLRDEARLLARLNHPTILKVFDLVILNDRVSLVAEYVEGQDLERCMVAASALPLRAMLEVVGQVASALHQAWAGQVIGRERPLRIVHRDIKPSNIRISRHGTVKLLDFGIARTDELEREALTQTDLMMGSPAYMAPERYSDSGVHPGSDVFALGCTLFESLVGERFFAGIPVIRMSAMSLDEERFTEFVEERLAEIPRHIPTDVVDVARATLRFEPDTRPSSEELMNVCEELADHMQGPTLNRWCRNRAWPPLDGEPGPLTGQYLLESGTAMTGDVVAQAFVTVQDREEKSLSQRTTAQTIRPAKQTHGDPTLVSSAAATRPNIEPSSTPGLPMPLNILLIVVGLGFVFAAAMMW